MAFRNSMMPSPGSDEDFPHTSVALLKSIVVRGSEGPRVFFSDSAPRGTVVGVYLRQGDWKSTVWARQGLQPLLQHVYIISQHVLSSQQLTNGNVQLAFYLTTSKRRRWTPASWRTKWRTLHPASWVVQHGAASWRSKGGTEKSRPIPWRNTALRRGRFTTIAAKKPSIVI